MATNTKKLPTYRLLGSSGLRVFPLSLGAMHFGDDPFFQGQMGVGQDASEAEKIFLRYLEAGGNFIDTANFYHKGQSETIIGQLIKKHNINRDNLVIATKYSLPMTTDPNASGNHKKNLLRAVNESLARLGTDYVDILYVHFWDWSVDVEDLMRSFDELIRTGKVLHLGASDMPAWLVAYANTVARYRGWNPFVVYQGKYNLVERDLEQDVFPMCKKFNIATTPWCVLGQGKLTGKKTRENQDEGKRSNVKMTEQDFKVLDVVISIAKDINRTPAQVALNWAMHKTTTPLLGPRTLEQLEDNLGALEFDLTPEQIGKLDEASKECPRLLFPHYWNGTNPSNCGWLYVGEKKFNIEV